MAMPKPQPRSSQKPGKKSDAAFCSALMWSAVISSTEGRERMRARPCTPLASIILPKARKSSTVETRPPAPDSKTGGRAKRPPRVVEERGLAGREIRLEGCREAVELSLEHAERGVLHAERREDALAQEVLQSLARRARNQDAQDVGAAVVHPLIARLVRERQAAEAPHQFVGCKRRQGCRGRDARLGHRLLDRVLLGINHHPADAEAKREQVAQRDRALRGHGVLQPAVRP